MKLKLGVGRAVAGLLLLIMMTTLARSIEQARWTSGLHVLFTIAVVGVVAGVLLASSEISTLKAHLIGTFGGLFVVMWQTGRVLAPEDLEGASRFGTVWGRLREWISVVLAGGTSYDELLFVFTMGAIVWFLAYNSSWFVLRYNWAWWAVLPTGLVMLVNLGYAIRPDYQTFLIFLLCSLLLMVQSQILRNSARWKEQGLGYDPGLGARLFMLGGIVSVVLLVFAWQAPSRSLALGAKAAFQKLEQPWERIHDRWQSAFAFLYPSTGRAPVTSLGGGFTSFSNSFELGGPLRMGNKKLFEATGDAGQYWKSVSYDTYNGDAWSIASEDAGSATESTIYGASLPELANARKLPEGVRKVTQDVRVVLPVGRALFAADTPAATNRPAEWRVGLERKEAQVPVRGQLSQAHLNKRGAQLEEVRRLLREIGSKNIRRASANGVVPVRSYLEGEDDDSQANPDAGLEAVATAQARQDLRRQMLDQLELEFAALQQQGIDARYEYRRNQPPVITYTYLEPNQTDQMRLVSSAALRKGTEYKVTSVVADPTEEQLDTAKGEIPNWVRERYLQVPSTVPDSVRDLAQKIVRDAGAQTTHEQAEAIESYLRKMKYREDMPVTPPGRDFVEYFLFDLREGYCTYFASAMAVMLRELGIPARVATGFAPGKYSDRIGRYEITEAQAHAWPQVYYPGLGWVNYEPTPIRDEVSRSFGDAGGSNPEARSSLDAGDRALDEALTRRQQNSATLEEGGGVPLPVRAFVTVLAALAVACLLIYVTSLVRLRGLSGAARQYAKLIQVGTAIGLAPRATQTPNEYGGRLGVELPKADTSVRRITSLYVAEVFGRQKVDSSELGGEWRAVASEAARSIPARLRRSVSRMTRR